MSSKFQKLFDAARDKQVEPELEQVQEQVVPVQPVTEAIAPKRRGRPKGKRSDPAFEQVTAYIRKDTHQAVKIALLQEGQDREFSELVEELLQEWLRSRT